MAAQHDKMSLKEASHAKGMSSRFFVMVQLQTRYFIRQKYTQLRRLIN